MASSIPRWAIVPPAFGDDEAGALEEFPLSEERHSVVQGRDAKKSLSPNAGLESEVTSAPENPNRPPTERPSGPPEVTGLRHAALTEADELEPDGLDTIPAPTWLGDELPTAESSASGSKSSSEGD